MIRRDYLLRMVEQMTQAITRLAGFKEVQQWQQARVVVDEALVTLTHGTARELLALSETELMARLLEGESSHTMRDKILFVTRLLKEAGDLAADEGHTEQSAAFYLKALHLLLTFLATSGPFDWPEYVPRVEQLLEVLGDRALPQGTSVLLMQHYERCGEFARAEDALFKMLDAYPGEPDLARFGMLFYERLLGHMDSALEAGNLPRAEVLTALEELKKRAGFRKGRRMKDEL